MMLSFELRSPAQTPLVFTRPRRSLPGAEHVGVFNPETLEPIDCEQPCTCPAGQSGRFCWALLEMLRKECVDEALRRWASPGATRESADLVGEVVRRAQLAREVLDQRARNGGSFAWR